VYFDLLEQRRAQGVGDVALVRVEQLYPWPRDGIAREIARYPRAEVVWCQEEPANMGAWNFVMRRIEYILEEEPSGVRATTRPLYVGRPASASPATGHLKVYRMEQEMLVAQALTWRSSELRQPFRRIPEP
jgi:2-oxoglutarate dehydrogenase E1 component